MNAIRMVVVLICIVATIFILSTVIGLAVGLVLGRCKREEAKRIAAEKRTARNGRKRI